MVRLLAVLLCAVLAAPAAAQAPPAEALAALRDLGVPEAAVGALFATEAEARALLGAPASEQTFPAEQFGGPDYRVLYFTLPDGAGLRLSVCTDEMRADLGIDPSFTFCSLSVVRNQPDYASARALAFAAQDALRAVASRTFGQCDTNYFVLGGVWVSAVMRGEGGSSFVLEFEPAR